MGLSDHPRRSPYTWPAVNQQARSQPAVQGCWRGVMLEQHVKLIRIKSKYTFSDWYMFIQAHLWNKSTLVTAVAAMASSEDDDDDRLDVSPGTHQRFVTAFAASKALKAVTWL